MARMESADRRCQATEDEEFFVDSLAGAGGVNFFILRGGIFIWGVEFLFWGGIFILRVEFLFGWNLGVEFLGMELSLMPNKRARSGNLCSVYSDQPALRTTVLGRPNPQGPAQQLIKGT